MAAYWREHYSAYARTKAYAAVHERAVQLILPLATQLVHVRSDSDFEKLLIFYQDTKQSIEDLFIRDLRSHVPKDHLLEAAALSADTAWGIALKTSIESLNSDPRYSLDLSELQRTWKNYILMERLLKAEQALQFAQTEPETKCFIERISRMPPASNERG